MEYMADYFRRLMGGNLSPDRNRKPKPINYDDGYQENYRIGRGGEWNQKTEWDD